MSGTDLLEVPTIYFWPIFEAYVREYPHEIWSYMVQYLHFRILEFQLTIPELLCKETIINQLISSLKTHQEGFWSLSQHHQGLIAGWLGRGWQPQPGFAEQFAMENGP